MKEAGNNEIVRLHYAGASHRAIARLSVEKLLVIGEREAYCQPCFSPVWDTGLVCHALLEAGGRPLTQSYARSLSTLYWREIYPHDLSSYRSSECRTNGTLDLYSDSLWP